MISKQDSDSARFSMFRMLLASLSLIGSVRYLHIGIVCPSSLSLLFVYDQYDTSLFEVVFASFVAVIDVQ